MFLRVLEFFGLWKSREEPVLYLKAQSCETLDTMILLKVATRIPSTRRGRV